MTTEELVMAEIIKATKAESEEPLRLIPLREFKDDLPSYGSVIKATKEDG